MPSSSIEAVNKKVSELIANPVESSSESEVQSSQTLIILTLAQRYKIGNRAAENGIAASLIRYLTGFAKMCMVHTSNYSTLVTYKIY